MSSAGYTSTSASARIWAGTVLAITLMTWTPAVSAMSVSGPSGKIAGRVIDAGSGMGLIGATVRIEGTLLGAAAGNDGYFTIINVPPGKYVVVASMVGFATVRVDGVSVSVDRTTKVDFELPEQVIEGEEIIVEATRPLIEVDRTTSASYIDAESISNLPVQEVGDLLQLQAGVVYDASGRLHLRGGRAGEVAYMVDGIPVTDQFRGGSKIEIENSWIQELQVISGTFNAEYGQAQSGVINVVTKDGGLDRYSGSVSSFVGSYLSSQKDVFKGATDFDANQYNLEASLEGPVPLLPRSSLLVNARYFSTDGWLYGQRRYRIEDTVPIQAFIQEAQQVASDRDQLLGIEVPDSVTTGDRRLVPMNPLDKLSLHASLGIRPHDQLRLSYAIFWTDQERKSYSDARRFAPDGQLNTFEVSANHIVSATHTLSASTFYRVGFSYQTNRLESYVFEDPLDPRYQGSPYSANGFLFGGTSSGHSLAKQRTMLAKLDLTSQVNRSNLIKVGAEFQKHRIEQQLLTTISDGPVYLPPTQRIPSQNTAGNDLYVQEPYEFSAYAQDKVEVDEIVINAGLRFDYWNPNALVPADLEATTDPTNGIRLATDFRQAETSMQLSPRVGIAFPISRQGVLHVSYGHFFQVPRFSYIFANSEFEVELGDLETIMGNANLKPERTIAYELGLQQGLTDTWKVELTIYYKDIKNLLGQEIINTRDKKVYARYINRDYGNTRGIVFSLIRQYADKFAATVDYTYQLARGNASDPNAVFFNNQTQPPIEPEKQVLPLDWDQRHTVNGTLILGDPSDWTLSIVGRFSTGQPYTPSNPGSQLATQLENSEVKPVRLSLDLNLAKRIRLMGQSARFFVKAYNVLDRLNPTSVYTSTGNPYQPYRTLGEADIVNQNPNFTAQEIDLRPDFFEEPRRVIVGVEIDF